MSRNHLNNSLRYQRYLTNNTSCLTCAIQQSLSVNQPLIKTSYRCLNCQQVTVFGSCEKIICPNFQCEHMEKLS